MKNELESMMLFEGHKVEVFEWNGQVLFNPYHVAECLDIAEVRSSIKNFNKIVTMCPISIFVHKEFVSLDLLYN